MIRFTLYCVLFSLLGCYANVMAADAPATARNPHTYSDPRGMVVDTSGNIYLLDCGFDEVVKLDSGGNILWRTELTMPDGTVSNAYELTANTAQDALYIQAVQAGVRAISTSGKLTTLVPNLYEYGVALDAAGCVYYPNKQQNRVERYISIDTLKNTDQGNGGTGRDNWQSLLSGPSIMVIDGNANGPAHLGHPFKVDVNATGSRIWVLSQDYLFRVFDQSGKFLYQVKAPDKKNRSFTWTTLAFDAQGNTFIACAETHNILKYNASGVLQQTIPCGEPYVWPEALALDQQENIYVGYKNYRDGKAPAWVIHELDPTGKLLRIINGPLRE